MEGGIENKNWKSDSVRERESWEEFKRGCNEFSREWATSWKNLKRQSGLMIPNMGSLSTFIQEIQSRPKKDTSGSEYNKPFSSKLTNLNFSSFQIVFQHVEHKKSDAMFKIPS